MKNVDDLVLDKEETIRFVYNMMHPNTEMLRRRDAFLSKLDDVKIEYCDGGIVADCPDISLPSSNTKRKE